MDALLLLLMLLSLLLSGVLSVSTLSSHQEIAAAYASQPWPNASLYG